MVEWFCIKFGGWLVKEAKLIIVCIVYVKILYQETVVLRTDRELLTQTLKETDDQIFRLLEVKRLLEHDWSDKQEAFQLDHSAAKLVNDRLRAQFKV